MKKEAFAQADADGDGVVDQEEFESGGSQVIGDYFRSQQPSPRPFEGGASIMGDEDSTTDSNSSLVGSSVSKLDFQNMMNVYLNSLQLGGSSGDYSLLSTFSGGLSMIA